MAQYERDANGILVLSAQDIEDIAEQRFLGALAPECLGKPLPTPLAHVLDVLQKAEFIRVDLRARLGSTPEGHKYLGAYDLNTKLLSIDESLADDDPRYSFTVAHELGHFYLHSKVKTEALGLGTGTISDSSREIILRRVSSSKPRTLLEWQANVFAAAILVPRMTIQQALIEAQKHIGIVKNLGNVWRDGSPDKERDFHAIIARLAAVYQTSRSVVRVRLEQFGLVQHRHRGRAPSRLGEGLDEALAELFRIGNTAV